MTAINSKSWDGIMKKIKGKEVKELRLKCDCGCKSQVLIQVHPERILQIDVRDSGRHKWHGVVFYKEKMAEVRETLKEEK